MFRLCILFFFYLMIVWMSSGVTSLEKVIGNFKAYISVLNLYDAIFPILMYTQSCRETSIALSGTKRPQCISTNRVLPIPCMLLTAE